MMKYKVGLTLRARRELHSCTDWIAEQSPRIAEQWLQQTLHEIRGLAKNPQRCAVVTTHHAGMVLRQLLCGRRKNYRVLFTIYERQVLVLAFRHASQNELNDDDWI